MSEWNCHEGSPKGIERERDATVALPRLLTPKSRAVLARLDEPIAMQFEDETPLEDVLKYITQATTKPPNFGIPIVVDALGLQEVEKTLHSTVLIDLEAMPLKTTLRLLLEQLGLAYTIKDGLAVISSSRVIRKLERGRMRAIKLFGALWIEINDGMSSI